MGLIVKFTAIFRSDMLIFLFPIGDARERYSAKFIGGVE